MTPERRLDKLKEVSMLETPTRTIVKRFQERILIELKGWGKTQSQSTVILTLLENLIHSLNPQFITEITLGPMINSPIHKKNLNNSTTTANLRGLKDTLMSMRELTANPVTCQISQTRAKFWLRIWTPSKTSLKLNQKRTIGSLEKASLKWKETLLCPSHRSTNTGEKPTHREFRAAKLTTRTQDSRYTRQYYSTLKWAFMTPSPSTTKWAK